MSKASRKEKNTRILKQVEQARTPTKVFSYIVALIITMFLFLGLRVATGG